MTTPETTQEIEEIQVGDSWYTVIRYVSTWSQWTEFWDGADDLLFTLSRHAVRNETAKLCLSAYQFGFGNGEKFGRRAAQSDMREALGL